MKNKVFIISSYTISLVNFRLELIKELKRQNFEVFALGPDIDEETVDRLNEEGVKFILYKLNRNGLNPLSDFLTIMNLRKLLKLHKPNYIIPYTIKPVLYANIAKKRLNIKSVSLITGLGYYANPSVSFKDKITKEILTKLYKFALNDNDVIAFQNTDDISFFKEKLILNKNSNYCITPGSGIDLSKFDYLSANDEKIDFLFIGRLIKPKGIEFFLEAAKKIRETHKNCTFSIIGMNDINNADAISEGLFKSYHEQGIINFIGEVKNVIPHIKNCSVFVLPSYYREGVPRTLLEALSIGRPIITTDSVGCRETVVKNKNGILIPIKDTNSLINAMLYFVINTEKINEYGKASRKLAETKFDVKIVNQIIFEKLIN